MNWMNKAKDWVKTRFLVRSQEDENDNSKTADNVEKAVKINSKEKNETKPVSNARGIAMTAGAVVLLAGITFAGNQYIQSNMNEVYQVYFDQELLGTVSSKQETEAYIDQMIEQYTAQYPDLQLEFNNDQITYQSETSFMAEGNDEEVRGKLDEFIEPQAVGVQLVVNDKVVGVLKNQEEVDQILEQIKNQYVDETEQQSNAVGVLSASDTSLQVGKSQTTLEEVEFVEEVNTQELTLDKSQLEQQDTIFNEPDEVLETLVTGDVKPIKYTVQEGDCISCIAAKFDIPKQVIYQNNDWIVNDMIKVGEELDLTVLQPELSVKTVELEQEVQQINYRTDYEYDDTMKMGQSEVLQEGQPGKKLVTFKLTSVNGMLEKEELVNEEVIVEPIPAVVVKGTKIIKGEGTGNFDWPVNNPTLTSSYGIRWGTMHKGIDLVSSDRDILAADNGEVIFAGRKSGYGNAVILDHHNGYTTLYGHLDEIDVTVGTKLEKGDKLGVMGNTGNSTGTHLHFEIIENGNHQNPLNYLE